MVAVLLTAVASLSLLASGCKVPGGCSNDSECKGDRICERGTCSEPPATPGAPPLATQATTGQPLPTAGGRTAPSPTITAASCAPCSTQEDFDLALRRGTTCCPMVACRSDVECAGSRVCCRIPKGQLCTDASRCKAQDRVAPAAGACSPPCKVGDRCVIRRAFGATFISTCVGPPPPDQCTRSGSGSCPSGKKCCHAFANACPGGLCEDMPRTCESTEDCAD